MPPNPRRRNLLQKSAATAIAGTAAALTAPITRANEPSPTPVKGVDYYEKLGVTPFINAAGTYTTLSASTMPPEVQAATALASLHPVNTVGLQDATGDDASNKIN